MLEELTAEEFGEWAEFCQEHEPFGDPWRQAALMPWLYVNARRRQGAQPVELDDLIPIHRPKWKATEQLGEKIVAAFKAIAASAKKARAEEKTDG